jgi:addiction module RelE/StbE family toxin
MVEIKFIVSTENFERDVKRVRDKTLKEKLQKQIDKITENPSLGKPLRYGLKGEWSIRVKPYRLIYAVEGDKLILLRFEHRKEAYET